MDQTFKSMMATYHNALQTMDREAALNHVRHTHAGDAAKSVSSMTSQNVTSDMNQMMSQLGGSDSESSTSDAFVDQMFGGALKVAGQGWKAVMLNEFPMLVNDAQTARAIPSASTSVRPAMVNSTTTKENALTQLLRYRQHLVASHAVSMPYVPARIYFGGAQLQGGGQLEMNGGNIPREMSLLNNNADTNYHRLYAIYNSMRNELKMRHNVEFDENFDSKMKVAMDNIRSQERMVRDYLIKMNLLRHLAPMVKSGQKFNGDLPADIQSKINNYFTQDGKLRADSLMMVDLMSQVTTAMMGM
jgi:hypothetical protein